MTPGASRTRPSLFSVTLPVVSQAVGSVVDDSFSHCFDSRVRC